MRAPPQARVAQQYNCGDGASPFYANVFIPPSPSPCGGGRFEVWDGRPSNTFSDHEVAVGLRCGKANIKTPRCFARLDPVFARDTSGRSVLFSIKEESTRLATSSPFSKRPHGKEPLRVKPLFPPARAPLLKTPTWSTEHASSCSTLTHVLQATSAPVAFFPSRRSRQD